jgi:hypothetical protein
MKKYKKIIGCLISLFEIVLLQSIFYNFCLTIDHSIHIFIIIILKE